MDPDARIEELLAWLDQARPVPFSTSVVVSREAFAAELEALRDDLPAQVREARLVLSDRDAVLATARREAERIVDEGRTQAAALVEESTIMRTAERRAEEVLAAARGEARRVRNEADDYIDRQLVTLDTTLRRTLRTVERGRARLAERADREPDAAPGASADEPVGEAEAVDAPGGPGLFDHERS